MGEVVAEEGSSPDTDTSCRRAVAEVAVAEADASSLAADNAAVHTPVEVCIPEAVACVPAGATEGYTPACNTPVR